MSRYDYGYSRRSRNRMSSDEVALVTVGVLSALVVGAVVVAAVVADDGEDVTADCVDTTSIAADGSYQPVDDRFCEGGSHSGYTHVFGGSSSGGRIRGGTTVRPGDVNITTRKGTSIQRGGFGGRSGSGGS